MPRNLQLRHKQRPQVSNILSISLLQANPSITQADPSSNSSFSFSGNTHTIGKCSNTEVERLLAAIHQQANLQHPRPTSNLNVRLYARSHMWEITVSAYRTPQTNKGGWSQHQQIPLNPDACPAQEGYVVQTLQNSWGQFIWPVHHWVAPKPPNSPSLHIERSMCFTRLHKKTMKANEKFHLWHRDGRIPHSKATTTGSPTASGFWWKNISLTYVLQLWLAVHLQRHHQHRISYYFRKNEVTFNFCPHFVLYSNPPH